MKYLILLTLLASCGSDKEQKREVTTLNLQCVDTREGTTCYGADIRCTQAYWNNGEMSCEVTKFIEVGE